jgi:putative membrane protein
METTMHRLTAIAGALPLTISAAHAQDKRSQTFLTEAIQGNYAEVEMGKLAQDRGQSDKVKSFGQMLTRPSPPPRNLA